MEVKNAIFCIFLLLLLFLFTPRALAQETTPDSSTTFAAILKARATDARVTALTGYLQKLNSPLAPYARDFIDQADFYHIDWRMLVAISGVESTFGQAEPSNCYNGWGYGIYGDHVLCFASYSDAIHTITKSIREQYMDTWGAKDIFAIGSYYAASPTWADRVYYFMSDIEEYKATSNSAIPISI